MQKKRLLTGVQPSGAFHLGNYFGAIRPFADMSADYESFLMIADYHALTSLKDPGELRQSIIDMVRDYVAVGVDPAKVTIFKQSDVPEHTELAWIFQCLVSVRFLELAHAYKDKVSKGLDANAGLFAYPMLMAADILLYDADIVPVGQDQRQHVEYAREAAAKFNNAFGGTFKEPKEKILERVATIPGIDGRKMSKSYDNVIPLFGTKDEIRKRVMSIVTDSKGESPEYVYAIHACLRERDDLSELYHANKGNYKALKEALAEDILTFVEPMRERRNSIRETDVAALLREGARRAREISSEKMRVVRQKIGVAI